MMNRSSQHSLAEAMSELAEGMNEFKCMHTYSLTQEMAASSSAMLKRKTVSIVSREIRRLNGIAAAVVEAAVVEAGGASV
jgi:hypothetical protein